MATALVIAPNFLQDQQDYILANYQSMTAPAIARRLKLKVWDLRRWMIVNKLKALPEYHAGRKKEEEVKPGFFGITKQDNLTGIKLREKKYFKQI